MKRKRACLLTSVRHVVSLLHFMAAESNETCVWLYRMCLKCFDRLQEWFPYIKTRRKIHINVCPNTVVEMQSPPPLSPDLLPLRVLSWEQLKSVVLSAPIKNRNFTNAYLMLLRPFASVLGQSIFRRVHACIDSCGGHFEHLLWVVTW